MFAQKYFNINKELIDPLKGSSHYVPLQGLTFCVICAPIVFGGIIFNTMMEFFETGFFSALITSMTIGIWIFIVDRSLVVERLASQNPDTLKGSFLAVRLMTLSLLILMAMTTTANYLSKDIKAHKSEKIQSEYNALINTDSELSELVRKLEDARRKDPIYNDYLEELTNAQQVFNEERATLHTELEGAWYGDGKKAARGKGSKSQGAQIRMNQAQADIDAINAKIEGLSYDPNELSTISKAIHIRQQDLRKQSITKFDGTMNKINYLFQVANKDWSNRFTMVLIILFFVFVDVLYFTLLSHLPRNRVLQLLFKNEEDFTNGLQMVQRHARRQEIADQLPTRIIEPPNEAHINPPFINDSDQSAQNEQGNKAADMN